MWRCRGVRPRGGLFSRLVHLCGFGMGEAMKERARWSRLCWAAGAVAFALLGGCGAEPVGGTGGLSMLIGSPCSAAGTSQCSLRPGGGSAVASCDGAVWQESAACGAAAWCAVVGAAPPQCMATGAAGDAASGTPADGGSSDSAAVKDAASVKDTGSPKDSAQDAPQQPDIPKQPDTAAEPDVEPDVEPPEVTEQTYPMPVFSMVDVNPASPTYKQAVSLQMFQGKRIVVLAGAGWCSSCIAQTKGMEKIRAQLAASGRDDFALLVINDVTAASNQKAITASVKVPVVQATSAVNGWKIMGAQKNDGIFFDYDGKKRGFFQGAGSIYTNIWEEWIIKSLGQSGQPTTGYTCKNGGTPGKWSSACSANGL